MNGENNSVIEHNNEIWVKNVFHQAKICKEGLADRGVMFIGLDQPDNPNQTN